MIDATNVLDWDPDEGVESRHAIANLVYADDDYAKFDATTIRAREHPGWDLVVTLNGVIIHRSEHHSLKESKTAAGVAVVVACELRGVVL